MFWRTTTITAVLALGSGVLAEYTSSHPDLADFSIYDQTFTAIIGTNASIELIYNATEALFHEGGVYNATGDTLYLSSNRLTASEPNLATANQTIQLHAVTNVSSSDLNAISLQPISTDQIVMPNGGCAFTDSSGLLFTAQGTKTQSSGIFAIPDPVNNPNVSVPMVTSFHGREFNSLNDVVVNAADNHTLWFTDPNYGFQQGMRNTPNLPTQVYRYDPATNSTRVVTDDIVEPNGLAFNADFSVLYITDTGASNAVNGAGPATIYAFDVMMPGAFLTTRRLFAYAPAGIPDGIKVDAAGNVWAGTGTGVTVWNSYGTLIGEVTVQGGAANFGFGPEGTLFVLNEKRLWRVKY